jgi:hypothetical protein
MLDRHAAAMRNRDERAFLADVAPGARPEQRQVFRNLAEVPLAAWSYRLVSRSGSTAQIELRYRIEGYDAAPVVVPSTLTLAGGRMASESGSVVQLWDQGKVRVVRGTHSLVLGLGDRSSLRAYAADADRAVPAVDRIWGAQQERPAKRVVTGATAGSGHPPTTGGGVWGRQVILEVPASLDQMAALLQAPAAHYRDIAAVTTAELGGSTAVPADRVVINPAAFKELTAFGRQVVLTHETTHVATRAATDSSTPLWLSEGFADWIGYLDAGRSPHRVAPELAADIAAGQTPEHLPADADFGTTATGLAKAYEGGWLACRLVAADWGTDKLTALYRAAAHSGTDTALRRVLGVSLTEFTARWRAYAQRELG